MVLQSLPVPPNDDLFARVVSILEQSRSKAQRNVNSHMVLAYWLIGREIVSAAQSGHDRAGYGQELMSKLSQTLTQRFGKGFSVTNLKYFRLFYQTYAHRQPEIRHEARDESGLHSSTDLSLVSDLQLSLAQEDCLRGFSDALSWTHYRTLCRVEQRAERLFYEIEAVKSNWSQPQLERQIDSHLFVRLIKSTDKTGVLALAQQGHVVQSPTDSIKHPYVLDFLGLPEAAQIHETQLEQAIMEKLQPFLLELGKGFAFVARQQRISTEHSHFYIDLVFYNYVLKCFVLIDLKMGKLTHQDVGQMDMYVRMYDDLRRSEGDNPSVGLILCAERDEVVVKYSVLAESQQLFASKYMLHLPTEEQLRIELQREQAEIAERLKIDRETTS
jgi:predicted nuclease of restriction endonuclease-like (RecB) superfamily